MTEKTPIIAVCGEVYSPNLGDGVIADSLTYILKQVDDKIAVSLVDFSGRTGGSIGTSAAAVDLNWLQIIHRFLGRNRFCRKGIALFVWYCSKRRRLRSYWRSQLTGSSLVLIGGGQLLMDNELSFILRIRELVRIARFLHIKVAFYACGIGSKWSRMGSHLLAKALLDDNVSWISARDHGSRETLQSLLPNCKLKCNIAMDPALFAAEAYGVDACPESNIIGLGILTPSTLRRRAIGLKDTFSTKRVKQFWINLARLLAADNQQFAFFTNGRSDDYAFAESIVASLRTSDPEQHIVLLDRTINPRTLVAQMARFRAIVAHRLHANIIAYSLCIPSVGLVWDKKVAEFGKMTKREHFYLDTDQMDAHTVRQRLYEAINAGIDESRVVEQKTTTLKNLKYMLRSLAIIH
jgi:polysaccharide pyruvyl transferase WcaK-like protein